MVLACHITVVYDVNWNQTIQHHDYDLVKEWMESMVSLELNCNLFYKGFSKSTIAAFHNKPILFVKTDYDKRFNPTIFCTFFYWPYM